MFSIFTFFPFLNGGLLSFLVEAALYVGLSLGLFKMAKKCGMKHAWLAWIPALRLLVLGNLADLYRKTLGEKTHAHRTWLLVSVIAYAVARVFYALATVVYIGLALTWAGSCMFVGIASELVAVAGIVPLLFILCLIPCIVLYFLFVLVGPMLLSFASYLLNATILARWAMTLISLNAVYSLFGKQRATTYTILSLFFDFLPPVLLPIISKNTPALPATEADA